ncbi:MAG: GTP 3',8-cyclase MoaA [Treponema sp.]|jgi:cyclic pyranopterin phosphate synthase|nr:GTP 3',8-cyclase MoaA [Treponema sp.]
MLIDSFGRILDYLRVSVTDRCNLRCVYCMPPEGVPWKAHDNMLRFEEILHLVGIMAELGIRKIKVTGGEPLVRRGMTSFLRGLKTVPGIEKVTLTTNGLLLGGYLDEAETLDVGVPLDGVNVSLDALDSERFSRVTGEAKARSEEILSNIDRLLKKRIRVKVNCVTVRGFNEEEILPLTLLAREKDIAVRFIELMPLGCGADLEPVPGGEVATLIENAFGALTPFSGVEGSGPAVYYSLPGFTGKIGFINPLSHGFCETCNRLRLTSEGFVKPCLSSSTGVDLRTLLRSGASDTGLAAAVTETVAKKPRFHTLSDVYIGAGYMERKPDGMFRIGG